MNFLILRWTTCPRGPLADCVTSDSGVRTDHILDGSRDKLGEAVSNQRAGNNKNDLCGEMKYTI